ncbi:hypothetical protein CIY_27380 [Butyrivibrio fibrisolvens 16/4]|nr:hypothetical protein CIY_27380 [Butyrivibrio fibrisolvens 16/4]
MKRILYLTNIPAPYTVDFFNELGKKFDLTVVFEAKNAVERDSSWEKFDASNFKYIVINADDRLKNSFKVLLPVLEKYNYDLCIIGNYASIVEQKTILWLRRNKKAYAIHADGGMVSKEPFLKYLVKRFFLKGANIYFSSGKITTDYFIHYGANRQNIHQYPFSSVPEKKIRKKYDKKI